MGDYFVCSKTDPVVETKAGKVRGFRLNTTYAFHGIHYAEADRFQMPQPVKPWKGINKCICFRIKFYFRCIGNLFYTYNNFHCYFLPPLLFNFHCT